MSRCGLLVRMHAKPGKDAAIETLLNSAASLVQEEPETIAWFAIRFGRDDYGIFEVFADDAARDGHLSGVVAGALTQRADELFKLPPRIQRLDVLAEKLPIVNTEPDTKGLLLTFRAKPEREQEVLDFLRFAQEEVNNERTTSAWFAIRTEDGDYGIFDVFHANEERLMHLLGHVPREFVRQAFTLLGAMPDLSMLNVQAEKLGPNAYAETYAAEAYEDARP